MRIFMVIAGVLMILGCTTSQASLMSVDSEQLVGRWKVDLRPTPGSDSYFNGFVITSVEGRSFSGTFFGTPITQARINTGWNAVRMAFATEDESGSYHHSAVLSRAVLEGLSNSTGRDFLSCWSATKVSPA